MSKSKEEILQSENLDEVSLWLKHNPYDEEVMQYHKELMVKEAIAYYGDIDFLPSPHLVKRK